MYTVSYTSQKKRLLTFFSADNYGKKKLSYNLFLRFLLRLLDHLSTVSPGEGNGAFDEISLALIMAALQVHSRIIHSKVCGFSSQRGVKHEFYTNVEKLDFLLRKGGNTFIYYLGAEL